MKPKLAFCQMTGGVLLGAILLLASRTSAADANGWDIRPVALMVANPDGAKNNRNFCWKPGVPLWARLTPPAGKIVGVDEQQSKVISFTDDLGTNLMVTPATDDPFNKPGFSCQDNNSETGEASVV